MMNPGEFMMAAGRWLQADEELQAWCQGEFGKPLSIQVGLDLNVPPDESRCPLVVLPGCIRERGDARQPKLILDISTGILDANIYKEPDGGFVVYSGAVRAAELEDRVTSSLFASNLGSFEMVGDPLPQPAHPVHIVYTTVRCTMIKSSRRAMR